MGSETPLHHRAALLQGEGLTCREIARKLHVGEEAVVKALRHAESRACTSNRQTLYINDAALNALKREARKRGVTPAVLASRILSTALTENLLNAVLDDEE